MYIIIVRQHIKFVNGLKHLENGTQWVFCEFFSVQIRDFSNFIISQIIFLLSFNPILEKLSTLNTKGYSPYGHHIITTPFADYSSTHAQQTGNTLKHMKEI